MGAYAALSGVVGIKINAEVYSGNKLKIYMPQGTSFYLLKFVLYPVWGLPTVYIAVDF